MSSSVPEQESKPSFKDQLDYKAKVARDPNYGKEEPQPTLLEKVTEYVPAVAKVLGTSTTRSEAKSTEPAEIPGPPERPTHDGNIEQFVRDQHRSKKADGELEV